MAHLSLKAVNGTKPYVCHKFNVAHLSDYVLILVIELKRYVEKECVFTGKLIGGMAVNCVVKTGPKINVRKQSLCVLFLCIGHIYVE